MKNQITCQNVSAHFKNYYPHVWTPNLLMLLALYMHKEIFTPSDMNKWLSAHLSMIVKQSK